LNIFEYLYNKVVYIEHFVIIRINAHFLTKFFKDKQLGKRICGSGMCHVSDWPQWSGLHQRHQLWSSGHGWPRQSYWPPQACSVLATTTSQCYGSV